MTVTETYESVMEHEALKLDALAWVNEYVKCDELPHGTRGFSHRCPLARALGAVVDAHTAYLGSGRGSEPKVDLPPRIREFVLRFDCGEYPELEA